MHVSFLSFLVFLSVLKPLQICLRFPAPQMSLVLLSGFFLLSGPKAEKGEEGLEEGSVMNVQALVAESDSDWDTRLSVFYPVHD